ncbi:MAG: recombination mediator RecR [Minisyncoccales bacterium]
MYSPTVKKLIDLFAKFPTVGPRTATRFVFYLLSLDKEKIEELTSTILKLKEKVKLCSSCYKSFEDELDQKNSFCEICRNPKRDHSLICLVEKEADLIAIENTKKYNGFYFILGSKMSALKKEGLNKTRIEELIKKIKNPAIKEIIIALDATTEGEATSLYLERLLKPFNKKITRLGRGLPVGGELEYADEETISSSLESRR